MFCRYCGKPVADQALLCVSCGCAPRNGTSYCAACGASTAPQAQACIRCGAGLAVSPPFDAKSKMAAGLLGIFLGGFGVHRFYLGFIGIGIAQIAVTVVTCGLGHLWGFIEGILILTGNINKDARGQPLRD